MQTSNTSGYKTSLPGQGMSETLYRNHPIRATLDSLVEALRNDALSKSSVSNDEGAAFHRDKIVSTVQTIKGALDETPAVLVNYSALAILNGHLQSILSEVTSFIGNGNLGHLSSAASMIDSHIMPVTWSFAPKVTTGGAKTLASIQEELRLSAQKTIEQLAREKETLGLQLVELSKTIEAQQSQLQTLTDAVASQKADALSITAQVQKAFTDQEAIRDKVFAKASEGYGNSYQALEDDTRRKVNELIGFMEQSKSDVSRIVEAVGNTGLTGNYQRIANDEAKAANVWRRITAGLFLFGILVAVVTFAKFLFEPFTPESAWSALIRLAYAFAIVAPAWYAAKESARHRSNSDRARQTELELASLGPYIELMPPEKKLAIREELVKKYFGNGTSDHEVEPPVRLTDMKDVAMEAIKALKKG